MTTKPSVAGMEGRLSQRDRGPLASYGLAVGFSILAILPSVLVQDRHLLPVFLFCYIAALAASWYGGLGPGLTAVAITLLAAWYFVIPQVNSFAIAEIADAVRLLTYVPVAVVTAIIVARFRDLKLRTDALLMAEREAREATEKAEHRNASLLESIGDAFYSLDADWRFTYVNRHAEQLLRQSRDGLLGRSIWEEFPESRGTIFEQNYKVVAETRKTRSFETYYAPLGFWTEVRAFPRDDGGVSVFFQDVNERHRLVSELGKNAQRFERTFNLAGVGIAHVGADGRWLRVNQRFCDLVGYTRPEMLSRTFQDITHPEDVDRDVELYRRLKAGEIDRYSIEKRYLHKNGSVVWVNLTVSMMHDSGGHQYAIAVAEDINERKAGEERLLALSAIVESSEDAIFGKTLQGVITTWNSGAAKMYGYSAAEIVGRPVSVLIPPGQQDEMPRVLARLAMGEHIGNYETVRMRKDGSLIDVSLNLSPIRDRSGRIIGASTIARNITQIKQRTSELESLLNNAPVGLAFFDREYRFLRINGALAEMNGLPAGEHIGRTLREIVPENAGAVEPILDEVFRTGRTVEREITGGTRREPGVIRTWITGFYPVFAGASEPFAVGAYVVEITDRKQAEQRVRQSEERLQTIIENLAEGLVVVDAEGAALHWNRNALHMHGYERHMDELIFLSNLVDTYELSALDGRVISFEDWPVRRMLRGEEVRDYELVVHNKKDNWERIFSYTGVLVPATQEQPQIGLLTIRDVTERKRTEQALRESEQRFRMLADNMSQFAWMADENGRIFWYNKRWFEYTGTSFEEMEGWGWQKVQHPDHVERVVKKIAHCFKTGEIWEDTFPLRGKDGQYRWFLSRAVPIRDKDGKVLRWFGTNTDITAQSHAEEALREREQELVEANRLAETSLAQLRATIDSMTEGVYVGDERGEPLLFNPALLRIYGFSPDASPRSLGELVSLVEVLDVDGKPVPASERPIMRALRGEAVRQLELKIRQKDTGKEMVLSHNAAPVRDASGRAMMSVVTVEDITALKQAEKALLQSEKLASVGRMAATIAHEINNPLETVMNAIYLASTYPGVPEQARVSLELAERELERVAHITRQTLGFYRDPGKPLVLDAANIIRSVLDLYAPRIAGRKIVLKEEAHAGSEIAATEGELRQILSNLIANSIDAINGAGTLYLRCRRLTVSGDARRVRVTVADTGSGIAQEHLGLIFEPFFTTKAELGTGLGLWVTHQLVHKNGGDIRVRSRKGCGTVFTLWFPAAVSSQSEAAD